MNIQSFRNKYGVLILICLVAIFLIYAIDILKLSYRLAGWKPFGEIPVTVNQVQNFVADTPDVIGYVEPGGSVVTCATTVAFVITDANEPYRCCDTGERIACLAGDFSNDIPASDPGCIDQLASIVGVPETLQGSKIYEGFGRCAGQDGTDITTVQIRNDGQILWKYLDVGSVAMVGNALRCIAVPLLLALIVFLIVITLRTAPREAIAKRS